MKSLEAVPVGVEGRKSGSGRISMLPSGKIESCQTLLINMADITPEQVAALSKSREELEARVAALKVSLSQIELVKSLKADSKLSSVQTIKTANDYYSQPLESRAKILQTPNEGTEFLCKTLVCRNSWFDEKFASDPTYPEYIGIVVQFIRDVDFPALGKMVKAWQNSNTSGEALSQKKFKYRQTTPEECFEITQCKFNGVTPFGWANDSRGFPIPIVMSDAICANKPEYLFLGAGEENTKVGLSVADFQKYHGDHFLIANITKK